MFKAKTLFILCSLLSFSWAHELPALPERGLAPADFVPKGWSILSSSQGDLDGDGRSEVALLLRNEDASLWEEACPPLGQTYEKDGQLTFALNTGPRWILLLRGTTDGFELWEQNSQLIAAPESLFGETFDGFTLKPGELQIKLMFLQRHHGERRQARDYRFSIVEGKLKLEEARRTYFGHEKKDEWKLEDLNFRNRTIRNRDLHKQEDETTTWERPAPFFAEIDDQWPGTKFSE